MPRKELKRSKESPDDSEGATEAPPERETEVESELRAVALQIPEGATGSVQRFVEGGAKAWCEDISGAEFSPALIRDRYGPGRYVIYWRRPDPRRPGQWIGAGSTPLNIFAPATTPKGAAPDQGAGALALLVEDHVKRMLDGQQLLQQMQMAVLKNLTDTGRGSSVADTLLPELVKALASRPPAPGLDLAGIIALADKLANRTSPTAAIREGLDLMAKAREISGEGGDGEPSWTRAALKGLDVLGRAIGSAAAPADGTAPTPAPGGTVPPAGAPEGSTLPPTAHALFRFLEPHIPPLLRHAMADHDPQTYAGVIFDQVAPAYYEEIRAYIARPDFPDLLVASFPVIGTARVNGTADPVLPWFVEMRDDLVTRITEALQPEPPPVGEGDPAQT